MADLRAELIATARAMQPAGLNRSTAGNVSVRSGDGFYITPTGMTYDSLHEDDIPRMALDGSHVGSRKRRPNGASTATSTPVAPKSAPCCTPIRRLP